MTLNIRKTDTTLIATVPPGSYNATATSLILFGKNFANYGTAFNENMVHLMEHFANQTPPLNPIVGQLWFDTTLKEMKVWQDQGGVLQWVLLNATSLQTIAEGVVPNRFYVSKKGDDANSGRSWFTAKRTIKSACAAALTSITLGEFEESHVTILVASGEYEEACPITVPPGVSIIGDNLRSVTVRPANSTSNVFLLSSGCYVYGLTVRGHQLYPSALDITPYNQGNINQWANASGLGLPRNTTQTGWAFSFTPGGRILVSPYIQNCSSISGDPGTDSGVNPGGGGVLVDPSVLTNDPLDPNRINSIVVDAFTQINLGGIGCKVVGKGYMQLVSFFINFCQFGILCVDGGHATLLNSNCSFGNYSLWAEGYRWLDNPQAVNQTWSSDGTVTQFLTTSNTKVYPDQYGDLVLEVNDIQQIYGVDFNISDGPNNNSLITLTNPPSGTLTVQARIRFSSLIEASGYTLSYAGAGLDYTKLSPSQGGNGRADPNKYTIAYSQQATNFNGGAAVNTLGQEVYTSGRIYHTSTDESGDFYVGVVTPGAWDLDTGVQASPIPSFRIDQQRGAIDGRAFYQSIFGFMAPFILALTRRG